MAEEPENTSSNPPASPNAASPDAPEYLIVGQVVAPFGIKGELKVNILTEFPERFKRQDKIIVAPFGFIAPGLAPTASLNPRTVRNFVAPSVAKVDGQRVPAWKAPKEPTPFTIESAQIHKGQLLLKLEGIDTTNQAELLRGYWLLVPVSDAMKLPRGAHYIYEIVGLDVYTEAGAHIGKIADVLTTSANDVYIVKGPGVEDPAGELLVPAIKSIVQSLDIKGRRVVIADPREWS